MFFERKPNFRLQKISSGRALNYHSEIPLHDVFHYVFLQSLNYKTFSRKKHFVEIIVYYLAKLKIFIFTQLLRTSYTYLFYKFFIAKSFKYLNPNAQHTEVSIISGTIYIKL